MTGLPRLISGKPDGDLDDYGRCERCGFWCEVADTDPEPLCRHCREETHADDQ